MDPTEVDAIMAMELERLRHETECSNRILRAKRRPDPITIGLAAFLVLVALGSLVVLWLSMQ